MSLQDVIELAGQLDRVLLTNELPQLWRPDLAKALSLWRQKAQFLRVVRPDMEAIGRTMAEGPGARIARAHQGIIAELTGQLAFVRPHRLTAPEDLSPTTFFANAAGLHAAHAALCVPTMQAVHRVQTYALALAALAITEREYHRRVKRLGFPWQVAMAVLILRTDAAPELWYEAREFLARVAGRRRLRFLVPERPVVYLSPRTRETRIAELADRDLEFDAAFEGVWEKVSATLPDDFVRLLGMALDGDPTLAHVPHEIYRDLLNAWKLTGDWGECPVCRKATAKGWCEACQIWIHRGATEGRRPTLAEEGDALAAEFARRLERHQNQDVTGERIDSELLAELLLATTADARWTTTERLALVLRQEEVRGYVGPFKSDAARAEYLKSQGHGTIHPSAFSRVRRKLAEFLPKK